ncbi:Fc.00g094050.m01.CDS01 [Cosmosporella sp. VM-42]
MHIKSLLLAPLLAASFASAAPSKEFTTFEVLTLRSASDIHFTTFQAANSNIMLKLPHEKATCKSKSDNSATFKLWDGKLYLYHEKTTPQQLFVDRSGMGQGKLGYTTDVKTTPSRWERKGWKIDKFGDLSFNGAGLLACPVGDGSWSVWVDVGIANPGASKGCLGLVARTIKTDKPNSCTYTK